MSRELTVACELCKDDHVGKVPCKDDHVVRGEAYIEPLAARVRLRT
jgi:hypothetical protein